MHAAQAFIALHLTRGTNQMKVPLLPFFFATAVLLSVLLLGRFLLLHEHLGSNSRETHDKVASSLHKLLRSQHKLEDRLEKLLRSVEAMQLHERQMEDTEMAQEVTGEIEEAAPTKHSDTAAADAACPKRSPFHTLLTSQASPYQQWQSRIAYHHWKKQKANGGPCSDMVGFHRLCATTGGKPDGLETEIPTIFTVQLSDEIINSHFGFGVLNRPNSVRQLLTTPSMREKLVAPYVLLLETDHVFMRPLPNLATETRPVAWDFGYMHANPRQNGIIQKYCSTCESKDLDPVGPSPLLIHIAQLEKLTQDWLDFSLGLRSNSDAEAVMQGWVQEMWGYSIAAAAHGIKHNVLRDLQVEASSLTMYVDPKFYEKQYVSKHSNSTAASQQHAQQKTATTRLTTLPPSCYTGTSSTTHTVSSTRWKANRKGSIRSVSGLWTRGITAVITHRAICSRLPPRRMRPPSGYSTRGMRRRRPSQIGPRATRWVRLGGGG